MKRFSINITAETREDYPASWDMTSAELGRIVELAIAKAGIQPLSISTSGEVPEGGA